MCVSRMRPPAGVGAPSLVTIAAGVAEGTVSAGFAPVAPAPPQPARGDRAKRRTQFGTRAATLLKIFMGIPFVLRSGRMLIGEVGAEIEELNVLNIALVPFVPEHVHLGEECHAGEPMPLDGCVDVALVLVD